MRKFVTFTSVLAATSFACGSSNNTKTVDAHAGSGSGSGSGSSSCEFMSTTTPPTYTSQNSDEKIYAANLFGSGSPAEVDFFGEVGTQDEVNIYVQLGGSDFGSAFGPKSNIDLSTSDDANAALLGAPNQTTMEYTQAYVSISGTLNVTSVGSAGSDFAGSISNVVFQHYDNILSGSAQPVPDPDGCKTTISTLTFSGTEAVGSAGFLGADNVQRANGFILHGRVR